jgi:hypothetical protein
LEVSGQLHAPAALPPGKGEKDGKETKKKREKMRDDVTNYVVYPGI